MTELHAATTSLADLLSVLAEADLARPVPACPGWTVRRLVAHVGQVHQWAAHAVVEGDGDVRVDRLPETASPTVTVDWYRLHAERLVTALEGRPAEASAWSFAPPHHHAGFWQRRQLHETLLHTRDVLDALGRVEEWRIEPALAWDGVREVTEMFYPRQVALGRTEPLPRSLRLVPTDVDEPAQRLGDAEDDAEDDAVELADTAERLLLVLWHRLPCADAEAASLTAYAVTP